jgi:hypothetical protein
MPSDYDSAWKEALHRYFPLALSLFFPTVSEAVDWSRGHEFLDMELRQIFSDSEATDRIADVLVKVTLLNGHESWLLIHTEVQNQKDEAFAKRMFSYYYRLLDRFDVPVCSLAILGDTNAGWKPSSYDTNTLGCRLNFEFLVTKLREFEEHLLETNANPFALVALAQLRANEAPFGSDARYHELFSLVRQLYGRGMTGPEIRSFYELLDWVLKLTPKQALHFREDLANYEKENDVAHISSIEQIGLDQGLEQGCRNSLILVLESRFGNLPSELQQILSETSADSLSTLTRHAATSGSLEEFSRYLERA